MATKLEVLSNLLGLSLNLILHLSVSVIVHFHELHHIILVILICHLPRWLRDLDISRGFELIVKYLLNHQFLTRSRLLSGVSEAHNRIAIVLKRRCTTTSR